MRRFLCSLGLLAAIVPVPFLAAQAAHLSIDASKTGAKIDRNIFGQFAENLGHGLYEGIWVGPDSSIPNTRGIRNDVVSALRAIKVPNVRWPGGCFADQYHWRKGIGPADKRPATLNSAWGGVVDPNSFGTDEFMDFMQQIGSNPYVSVNVGSGTPQEASEWLEYMTAAAPTALEKERVANGHPDPYKVGFMGIGNETWSCGGDMTPDYYVSQLKIYSRFVDNVNPSQKGASQMLKIAVGPGFPETEWTEAVMKAWKGVRAPLAPLDWAASITPRAETTTTKNTRDCHDLMLKGPLHLHAARRQNRCAPDAQEAHRLRASPGFAGRRWLRRTTTSS